MLTKTADGTLGSSRFMNRSARVIAERMNGQNTVDDIVQDVLHRENASEEHAGCILRFMDSEVEDDMAALHPEPGEIRHRVTGSSDFFHPTAINVELTYRCNCKCLHCYVEAGDDASQDDQLTGEDFIGVFGTLIDRGVESLEVTGGEAMLHPDFWDIMEYIASRGIICALLSNGSLVTREVVDRLAALNLKSIQISVDGPNAEMHDYFRQLPGSFQAACRAIRLFAERTDIPIRMATSAWSGNYHLMDEMVNLACELGATSFASSPINNNGRAFADGTRLAMDRREHWVYTESMVKLIQTHGANFLNVIPPQSNSNKLTAYMKNCGAGSASFSLAPNGDVRPCGMSPPELTFGNLKREPFEQVFSRNTRFAQIPHPRHEDCGECPSRGICPPCVIKGLEIYGRMRVKGFEACKWAKVNGVPDVLAELGWDVSPFATGGCTSASACGIQNIML
ncbi:MAG: radical SAM protein [Sedimentisphaerales bacterium]|nr:radical SAM protein [Sedimentisphaerales bacterium]